MMKKVSIVLAASLISLTSVLASGYGGYDRVEYETTPIEIEVRSELKATCEEAEKSIVNTVKVSNCDDEWVIDEKCDCIGAGSETICEAVKTIGCQAQVDVY